MTFEEAFLALTGYSPMRWQRRLFDELVRGRIPDAVDLPTGLGKTSVIAIWLLARGLADDAVRSLLPRRLVYVVDRRAVVDQATDEAEKLRSALDGKAKHFEAMNESMRTDTLRRVAGLKQALGLADKAVLPISTLRGRYADNRAWLDDPAATAIIVGTVDMTGSRLLFSGYGVSRKMRPFHAGLIGADTLLVLDEAHLVPPFEALVRTLQADKTLRPADGLPVPPFILLPLSATLTGQTAEGARQSFGLVAADREDEVAGPRLNADKALRVEALGDKEYDRRMAEVALTLATRDGPKRIVVFCSRRDKKDEGGAGPSAQGVAEAIVELAKGDKKSGREKIEIEPPELLVGGRRVHERGRAAARLRELGLVGEPGPLTKPVFLVATSAGEVGVDIDADHMVADLAPWERMVQRLGRVNRRGKSQATVVLFDTAALEKDADRRARLEATLALLQRAEGLGPAALASLKQRVGETAIGAASTPAPLHPALTRPLADAWSMTSLDVHPGRPEIEPWLRGWVDDEQPQTTLVWRTHLPIVLDENDRPALPPGRAIAEFFEAAPPHASEMLETETFRVVEWLEKRAKAAAAAARGNISAEAPTADDEPGMAAADEEAAAPPADRPLTPHDIVLLVLSPADDEVRHYTLGALAAERKGRDRDQFLRGLVDKTLVLDARFGGLADTGLLDLDPQHTAAAPAVDAETLGGGAGDPGWQEEAGFRVTRLVVQEGKVERYEPRDGWRFGFDLVRREDAEGDAAEVLRVERFRKAVTTEDARSTALALQLLTAHQSLAARKAQRLGELVGLSGFALDALVIAARLHDEGKAAERWQRAFRAPMEMDAAGRRVFYAKTPGPISQGELGGYRHEFGSLPIIERDAEFNGLPEDWRDLVLHLVAAHHGNARPTIAVEGADDAPDALAGRARDVALRFARMQKRWGPWGLAWWESLLRAADQQASRDADIDDEGSTTGAEAANG